MVGSSGAVQEVWLLCLAEGIFTNTVLSINSQSSR